jgi:hypothetical protein
MRWLRIVSICYRMRLRNGDGCMDRRRLVIGVAVLLLVVGGLLACFAPGGLLNKVNVTTVDTPLGSFSTSEAKSSPWPVVGYVLLGLGGVGAVVGYAMKPSRP